MKNIIVIGGGFGGVYATKRLLHYFKHDEVCITLINKTNYFLFVPMLHEVATGSLSGYNITEPLREILYGTHFRFVKGEAQSIDLKNKTVSINSHKLHYDYLVLATGSHSNFYSIPGAEKFTLPLKSLEHAKHIKNHIIESIEYAFQSDDEKEKIKYATLAVIGAGATGIEFSIEAKELLDQLLKSNADNTTASRVILIHSHSEILSQFPQLRIDAVKALKKHNIELVLNDKVTKVEQHKLTMKDGRVIDAATIIWTAGIEASSIPTTPKAADKNGKFIVNEFLQLPLYPEVFAVGDCASYTQQGKDHPMPALAQVAAEAGKHVAKNIYFLCHQKELEPFMYELRGILLSLGRRKGAGIIKGIKIKGFPAWFIMRTIYLFKIIGTVNKLKTAYEWTLNLFSKRDTSQH